jgi:hypothetical protein
MRRVEVTQNGTQNAAGLTGIGAPDRRLGAQPVGAAKAKVAPERA